MAAALLACDWGTTHLRAWTLDAEGAVLAARTFELGVGRLAPGEAAARFEAEVRPALAAQGLPAILCGMVGSDLGWTVAPYADCPAGLAEVAAALVRIPGADVRIAPGLRCRTGWGTVDVMRGEETQILGWIARRPARAHGTRLVCHPGTHAKWALIEDGRIVRFQTAMTGELFAVLRAHSVLKGPGAVDDPAAFDEGLAAAGDGQALASRLFSARARVVGEGRPAEGTASYLSGLLIGADVAAMPGLLNAGDLPVALLGDPALCGWYARALAARGVAHTLDDGEAAAVAGLHALWKMETAHAPG
jgi:2-dehydro-3-deoxygalactonokinase